MSFLWGAATSGHQVEGNNLHSDWWDWELKGNIEGGARSGAATDHWNRYEQDLKLAKDLGLTSYRFSVEWSRIEPEKGRYDFTALAWYRKLILECEKQGLLPMLTLHHFTSPQWFAEEGGFAWEGAPRHFLKYVELIRDELGSRVPLWCTINEPMVLLAGTYLGTFMPPAKFDPKAFAKACHNLLKCHALAYDLIHALPKDKREGPWKEMPLGVGIAHNMLDFMPDRRWHPMEYILTGVFWRFYNQAWPDAIMGKAQNFGVIGLVPNILPVQEALGRKTADFMGVNYYTKAYVQWRPRSPAAERPSKLPLGVTFARRKETVSDLEWAIHPKGFRKILHFASRYPLPIYITENGIADHRDIYRPFYLFSHLIEIAKAIENGIDIRGYYHWSLLDNFEWVKGFAPRFGLYRVNFENFERTPTGTALLLKKLIEAHLTKVPQVEILNSPSFNSWHKTRPTMEA